MIRELSSWRTSLSNRAVEACQALGGKTSKTSVCAIVLLLSEFRWSLGGQRVRIERVRIAQGPLGTIREKQKVGSSFMLH